jgi:hypothetical protein
MRSTAPTVAPTFDSSDQLMKSFIALAATLAAFSFAAPADARTCKQNVSELLNNMAPYSGLQEYTWREVVRRHRKALIDTGCDPVSSGFEVKATGLRIDNMLYGGPDPNGY